jgi:hypothetical protein
MTSLFSPPSDSARRLGSSGLAGQSKNHLLDYLAKDDNNDIIWKFKTIVLHQGHLTPKHHNYKGSTYNIMLEWENGETTMEPLQIIAKDDPVEFSMHDKDNGLLDTPGWKHFKSIEKRQKKFTRMVNQAKPRSHSTATTFKSGYQVARNYAEAVRLDKRYGTNFISFRIFSYLLY